MEKEKQKRNRATTTQHIIEALEQVLTEKGLDGVGIHAVAERAGVSKVLIYRYFGNLEGLVDYYVRMGRLFPHYTPAFLNQLRPLSRGDMARLWSKQSIQLFRRFRSSRAAREVLKATVTERDALARVVSKAQDEELVELVHQLSFVEEGDSEATSAVVIGALSYLTLLAQNNRPMIGIDLRSEDGWKRIEKAVEVICKALSMQAGELPANQVSIQVADEWVN